MTPMFPVIIRRSVIGLLAIIIAGIVVESLLFAGVYWLAAQGADITVVSLVTIIGVVVAVVTLVAAYIYNAAYIELSDEGVKVSQLKTLFWRLEASCEWSDIEEVDISAAGLLATLFNTGTLLIETAGAKPNLSLNWLPQVDYWRDFIKSKANSSPQLVHNV